MIPEVRHRVRTRPGVVPESAPTPAIGVLGALALKIVYRPIGALKPSPRNARTHSDKQIHQLMGSFLRHGFNNPILVDNDGEVIAGHGRLEAARRLGMSEVPTICLSHMTEADKRAYRIADNKLAQLAGWDDDLLRVEFAELIVLDPGLLELTGFETAEIDLLIDGPAPAKPKADPADKLPAMFDGAAVSRPGDCWVLGDHRIVCGDARDAAAYDRLLGCNRVHMVFTDPPYNVKIDGHVGGLGKVKHREFAMASGEMSPAAFTAFLKAAFEPMAAVSVDGAILFTCIDWAHLREMLEAGHTVFDELKNIICWSKTNGGMGSLYRSQHELIPVWKKGTAPHVNTIQLGVHGRYRTNVWTYAGVNTFRRGRMEELSAHPTVKPCALVMDAIKDCSRPGQLVLDPFGGSGTTLIAAEKTRRHARLIEFDPAYVDLTVRRWQALTKRDAHLDGTDRSFDTVAAERGAADNDTTSTQETTDVE